MKKFLLATTALVATTGVAAADMAVTGSAEMGLYDSDSTDDTGMRFFQDVDVSFTGTSATDSGLAFGFAVDLDEGSGAATGNNDDDGGVAIFLSSDFGTVTMGDTDGALDWALTEAGNIGNPGSINDDETAHSGYNGSYLLDGSYDGQILRYDHSVSSLGFAFSIEMDDDTATSGHGSPGDADNRVNNATSGDNIAPLVGDGETGALGFGLGVKYSLDIAGGSIGLGGGFQMGQDAQDSAAPAGNPATQAATTRIFGDLAEVPVDEFYGTQAFGMSAVYTSSLGVSAGFQFASITVTPSEDLPGTNNTSTSPGTLVTDTNALGRKATALTHFGLGGGYSSGPFSVHANYGSWSSDEEYTANDARNATHETSRSGFGLAAGYSLGGGASVKLGYSSSTTNVKDADAINKVSVGLAMSF